MVWRPWMGAEVQTLHPYVVSRVSQQVAQGASSQLPQPDQRASAEPVETWPPLLGMARALPGRRHCGLLATLPVQ
eukprot:6203587-Lingulodinium_polyedra.AAC.1